MKKSLIILAAGALLLSCTQKQDIKTVEQKASDYAAQLDSVAATGDSAAVVALSKEITEWQAGLSQDVAQEASKLPVFSELIEKATSAVSGSVKEVIESVANVANSEVVDAAEGAVKEQSDAAKEAVSGVVDEAKSQAKEVSDAAKQKATNAVNTAKQKTGEAIDASSKKANDAVKSAADEAKKSMGL